MVSTNESRSRNCLHYASDRIIIYRVMHDAIVNVGRQLLHRFEILACDFGVALSMSHLLEMMADVLAKDLGDESGLDLLHHPGLRRSGSL
jgi:uncharacterized membrane protein YGL010W